MTMRSACEAGPERLMAKSGPPSSDSRGAVDHRVDGRGLVAALLAQDRGRLAGEGAEGDLALDRLGDVAGERGLAGAGIAEQAEQLRRARA